MVIENVEPKDQIVVASQLEELARRIIELRNAWRQNTLVELLKFKWLVGKEISVTRVLQDDLSLRQLANRTNIHWMELHRCIQFYEKFPDSTYPLKAWRRIVAELPVEPETALPAGPVGCEIFEGDFIEIADAKLADDSVDVIITDPPYGREHLGLYEGLAKLGGRVLKPGRSLLVMTGESYLPEVFKLMTPHIQYYWTIAYLTPGGQSAPLWAKRVNTFWKPVLWFVKGEFDGDYVGDVVKSSVNDNDKRFSEHGQSESGMADLVEKFTKPNWLILDPFMGTGTTGVVTQRLGRRFVGFDIDPDSVKVARIRIELEELALSQWNGLRPIFFKKIEEAGRPTDE